MIERDVGAGRGGRVRDCNIFTIVEYYFTAHRGMFDVFCECDGRCGPGAARYSTPLLDIP